MKYPEVRNYRDGSFVGTDRPFIDVYSSAMFFDGWTEKVRLRLIEDEERPVVPASTWLLAAGWRKAGGISLDDSPA